MRFFTLMFALVCVISCQQTKSFSNTKTASNPAVEGFDSVNSDTKAIAIADQVMEAMGGRAAWDRTRLLAWTFFGRRTLTWDKHTGNVSIQIPEKDLDIRLNVHDSSIGKVMRAGENIGTQADTLSKYLKQGKSIWINDSYWLVMPFKLKDSGVTLKYVGQDTTQAGTTADVLALTFQNVGDTPENKYHVYVDTQDHLVKEWSFFREATDEKAAFSTPWVEYKQHSDILLSGNRGRGQLTAISAHNTVPDSLASRLSFD